MSSVLCRILTSSCAPLSAPRDIEQVRAILASNPEICMQKHKFGHRQGYGVHAHQAVYPLLQLCFRQAPADLVQLAYEAFPEAIKDIGDAGKYTALHWACAGTGTPIETIQFLADTYPDALSLRSWGRMAPIHHACAAQANIDTIQFLAQRTPRDVLTSRNNHANTLLHLACTGTKMSAQDIEFLIALDESAVQATSRGLMNSKSGIRYHNVKCTPLHIACGEGANVEVIQVLARHYPEALQLGGGSQVLPLHLACIRRNPSLKVIKFLVEAFPEALRVASTEGCTHMSGGGTPLQLAAKSQPSMDLIQYLYEKYPEAVNRCDNNHSKALQYACSTGASPEVVTFLMDRTGNGSGCATINPQTGLTLLHSACYNRGSYDQIKLLLEKFPDAAKISAKSGDLPLHAACQSRSSLDIIQLVVSRFPDAVKMVNSSGDLPLHRLLQRRPMYLESMIKVDVMQHLVNLFPGSLVATNKKGQTAFEMALHYFFPVIPSASSHLRFDSRPEFHQIMQTNQPLDILRGLTPRIYTYTQSDPQTLYLPLHYVASLEKLPSLPTSKEDNFQTMIARRPDGTTVITRHQMATRRNNPRAQPLTQTPKNRAIQFILQKQVGALTTTNDLGERPLHVACRTGACMETVKEFLEENPVAVEIPRNDGMTPFLLASQNSKASLDLIFFLAKRSMFAFANLPTECSATNKSKNVADKEDPLIESEDVNNGKTALTNNHHHQQQQQQEQQKYSQELQALQDRVAALEAEHEQREDRRHRELEKQIMELKHLQNTQQQNACCIIL